MLKDAKTCTFQLGASALPRLPGCKRTLDLAPAEKLAEALRHRGRGGELLPCHRMDKRLPPAVELKAEALVSALRRRSKPGAASPPLIP